MITNSSNSKGIKTGMTCGYQFNYNLVKVLSIYESGFDILYPNGKVKFVKGMIDDLPIYKSDEEFKLQPSNLTLTIPTQSAQIVAYALELYVRLNLGQLHELHNNFCDRNYDIEALEYALNQTKILLFPELDSHSSYGIYNKQVKDDVKVVHDIYKEIKHSLCDNPMSTHFGEVCRASDKDVKVEVE